MKKTIIDSLRFSDQSVEYNPDINETLTKHIREQSASKNEILQKLESLGI